LLSKVEDFSQEKRQWIENRLSKVSDVIKKAGKVTEVSVWC